MSRKTSRQLCKMCLVVVLVEVLVLVIVITKNENTLVVAVVP